MYLKAEDNTYRKTKGDKFTSGFRFISMRSLAPPPKQPKKPHSVFTTVHFRALKSHSEPRSLRNLYALQTRPCFGLFWGLCFHSCFLSFKETKLFLSTKRWCTSAASTRGAWLGGKGANPGGPARRHEIPPPGPASWCSAPAAPPIPGAVTGNGAAHSPRGAGNCCTSVWFL